MTGWYEVLNALTHGAPATTKKLDVTEQLRLKLSFYFHVEDLKMRDVLDSSQWS